MDVRLMLTALRQERAQVEEVILNLERLALTRESRRGRPPGTLVRRKRGRPPGSKNRSTVVSKNGGRGLLPEHRERAFAAGHGATQEQTAGKMT